MIHCAGHFWEPESQLSRKSVLGQFSVYFNYDFTGEMCASPCGQWDQVMWQEECQGNSFQMFQAK